MKWKHSNQSIADQPTSVEQMFINIPIFFLNL